MRGERRIKRWRFFLMVFVFLGLTGMGVTYAKWSDQLKIDMSISSGVMDIRYSKGLPCKISLVDKKGNELIKHQTVEALPQNDGKTIDIELALPFNTDAFLKDPDIFIRIECPLESGEHGTINAIEKLEADFLKESEEEVIMKATDIILIKNEGKNEYKVPKDREEDFNSDLKFDLYREINKEEGLVTGVVYLRMAEESRALIKAFPSEVKLEAPEADDIPFDAQLEITYQFSIPIYVEQGNKDVILMQ